MRRCCCEEREGGRGGGGGKDAKRIQLDSQLGKVGAAIQKYTCPPFWFHGGGDRK